MRCLALVLLISFLPLATGAQESVVTGMSADSIALDATFEGSDLFVFGAIRRDAPTPEGLAPLDVVITIKGPPEPVVVRRKERWFGIWINAESVRVRAVPSFYAIASTRPLADLLSATERLRYQIGMDQAVRRVAGHPALDDTAPFAEAVVRLRKESGLYVQADGGVKLSEETLFQTRFELPANLVEGIYQTEFFLVRDREVISTAATVIDVSKAGIGRWLYNLAHTQPLVYGVVSVAAALFAGWLAAVAFRLLKR